MIVAAWLEDWITQSLAASDRKQATKDLYATLARTHLVPTVGPIPLGRLRPSDVEALVVTERDAGLSASTVRTVYTVLRSALDIAARDGLIRSNPAAAVRRPGVERKDAPHLAVDRRRRSSKRSGATGWRPRSRVLLATGPSVRRSSARRPIGPTRRSTGDRCCPSARVSVLTREAGHPRRVTRL